MSILGTEYLMATICLKGKLRTTHKVCGFEYEENEAFGRNMRILPCVQGIDFDSDLRNLNCLEDILCGLIHINLVDASIDRHILVMHLQTKIYKLSKYGYYRKLIFHGPDLKSRCLRSSIII